MNKRGKKTDRAKDVKKIAISFTIVKNITAETGNKTLYIRIAKPGNEILSKGNTTFQYEDRQITYSIKNTLNIQEKNRLLPYIGMYRNFSLPEHIMYTSLPMGT